MFVVTPITPLEKPKKPEFDLFSLRPRIGNSDEKSSHGTDTQKDDDFGDFIFDEESSGPSEISPVPRAERSSQPKNQTKLSQPKSQTKVDSGGQAVIKSPQKSQQKEKTKVYVPSSQNSVVVDLTESPPESSPLRSKRMRDEVVQSTPESKPRKSQSSGNDEIVKTSQRGNEIIVEDDIEDPEFNLFFETNRESPQKKRKLERTRSAKKKPKRIDYLDVLEQNQSIEYNITSLI
jgi:hypothetical protein